MQICAPLFLLLGPCLVLASTQATSASLPPCATQCLFTLVPRSTCTITDQACICSNEPLLEELQDCVLQKCTVKEGLVAQNFTATACSWPVKDETPTLRSVTITLSTFASVFVAARIATKLPALHGTFGLDDGFILAAWALSVSLVVLVELLCKSGLGRNVWTLPFDKIYTTLKLFRVAEKVYLNTVWITKISILSLYYRLFPDRKLRRMYKAGMMLCGVTLFCTFSACVFECWPISYSWTYWDGEHKGSCSSMSAQGWANSALNILADLIILLLPLPTVWKLHLSVEKKLGIIAMFNMGVFVTLVSTIRLKSMKYFTFSANPTIDFVQLSIWSVLEAYVGIICACMPGMRSFYTHVFRRRKLEETTRSTMNRPTPSGGSDTTNASSDIKMLKPVVRERRDTIKVESDFDMRVVEVDSVRYLSMMHENMAKPWRTTHIAHCAV